MLSLELELPFASLSRLSKSPVAQARDFAARTLPSRFAGGREKFHRGR